MPPDDGGGYYSYPALHGGALAFVCEDEAWGVDAAGGVPRRLSAAPGAVSRLCFSPDGATLAFSVAESGYQEARGKLRRRGDGLLASALLRQQR